VRRLLDASDLDIFVCSNDPLVQAAIVELAPRRIFGFHEKRYDPYVDRQAAIDGTMDLLGLSRCRAVYGHAYSTFSIAAAMLGRVPLGSLNERGHVTYPTGPQGLEASLAQLAAPSVA